ncbi:carbohydrate ABC transporter permease [Phytoactinopolyspora halotolerans]|uniref:Sugar ABC transporter permease n=1 Tax=Phytoactinopolyspora halotolerans TaxID=1981512 RepID=A0A6L9SH27_9ACTN|nr:sugar ABC transporter permease [Phytoactinopolyspora halotolerans]NEE03390.1 sugar ABC transporter permease [Phytoactinopolyspora halotolerans]
MDTATTTPGGAMKPVTTTSGARKPDAGRRFKRALTGYLFVAPVVVLMGVFVFYPLAQTVYLTFFDYSFLADTQEFVGVDNYVEWAQDPMTWQTLWVSVKFFLYYVLGSMVPGLVIAIMIDRLATTYAPSVYRTIFYFPVVLPAAIVFSMWLWIYDPTLGMFAHLSDTVGADSSPNWLGDPDLALPSLAIMNSWRFLGETVIFFLIGLAAIPRDYVEAARTDGAGEVKIVVRIIIPLLMPFIFLVFVLRLRALELVTEPLFMTQGGPVDATRTYGLEAYELFHNQDRIGYADTWFVLLAVISLVTAGFASRRLRSYQT